MTSALDMLQDTAWALETYATEVDGLNEDRPHAYIRIFGVSNGLVIQQDAAFLLFKALGAPKGVAASPSSGAWAFSIPDLGKARHSRIAGAGHPIEWGEKRGDPASTFIVQRSVSSQGCQLMVLHHGGKTDFEYVSLKSLIEAQHAALGEQCRLAASELDADDQDHRMRYQSTQLMSIFAACEYWTPKVALAVAGSEPPGFGLGGLDTVEDALVTESGVTEVAIPGTATSASETDFQLTPTRPSWLAAHNCRDNRPFGRRSATSKSFAQARSRRRIGA